MSKHNFPLAAFVLLCLVACNKPENSTVNDSSGTSTPSEVTRENLVGSYRVTKVEARTSTQRSDITNTWFSSYAGDCSRDDLTIFNPDESFAVLDGTVVCDESTDDTGTWKLLSKTQLKLDSDTAEIEAFTNTTLRLVSPTYSTPQQDLIFTYTRQ